MLRSASTLSLGLLILTACPGDDTGTTAGGSAGSSTTTSDPTDGNPTDTAPPGTTTEMADTTAGMTTETPGTTTDDPGTTTDEPGTTTGGPMDACAPEPADDACATCVKTECCPELEACQLDAGCTCFQDCAELNPGVLGAQMCADMCMVDPFDGVIGPLTQCTIGSCGVCLGG